MEWQRERHSRRSQLVQRRSGPRARPGVSGPGVIDALQHGDAMGSVWRPAEADVSIRPGWFYHPAEDARVKTAGQLVNLS